MKYLIFFCLLVNYGFTQELDSFVSTNIKPLKTIKKVHPNAVSEKVLRLENAKVMIADYELIKKDFPAIKNLTNEQIDHWLINEVGFISKGQANQTIVNTHIPTSAQTRTAHRPPEYGRALVYTVRSPKQKFLQQDNTKYKPQSPKTQGRTIGIIDVKGAGGVDPSHMSHKSGTMTLGESLREFSYEKMISSVIDHSGIENKVVGSYAVIYPGFDVINPDGSKDPAGFYLRQAHRRYTQVENTARTGKALGNGWMNEKERVMFKKLLNKFGIFANHNYQGTIENNLFDFGHYIIRNDLEQINKSLQIPFDKWGFDNPNNEAIADLNDRWKFSKRDRPWVWSHETAKAWVKGSINRHHVWMHHYNLIRPVQESLNNKPRLYELSEKLGFKVKVCQAPFDLKGH